ncbi:hypothetical protein ACWEQO_20125 [Streptomyces sp. NPDC004051]
MSAKQACRQWSATRLLPPVVVSAASTLYALWIRLRLLTWGATEDETGRACPGDGFFPEADGSSVMATTLPTPPERV